MRAVSLCTAAGGLAAAMVVAGLGLGAATAQEANSRYQGEIRDLRLGLEATNMPEGYYEQACGSNGGPPGRPIEGFEDFMICPPEPSGLREVYFTFDDELAQIARLNPQVDLAWVNKFSGTVVAGFPVIASVLFDEAGVVRGIRAVTDSRAPVDKRNDAYLFRIPVQRRYGPQGWDCIDLPRAKGETDFGGQHLKRRCEKIMDDKRLVLETHLYRKAGQQRFTEAGQWEPGELESSSRLEIWDPAIAIP